MELTLKYLQVFLQALQDPEYSFLFFEPILLYGVAFGLITFIFGLSIKEQKTQMFGLICIAGACLTVAPYLNQRKTCEDRIIQVFTTNQPDRAYGFTYNNEDRIRKQWLFWLTAGTATLTLLFNQTESRTRVGLTLGTVVFSLLTIVYASLAHYEESKVYHPNLRREMGPSSKSPPSFSQAPRDNHR